jgi:hypothetical protein
MYRIRELNQIDRKLFHTNDLAVLWGIANRHNLYMAITRYIDNRVLFPVYKGLYSTVPLSELNPLELGRSIIHRFTYLTTETVLSWRISPGGWLWGPGLSVTASLRLNFLIILLELNIKMIF